MAIRLEATTTSSKKLLVTKASLLGLLRSIQRENDLATLWDQPAKGKNLQDIDSSDFISTSEHVKRKTPTRHKLLRFYINVRTCKENNTDKT